MRAPCRPSPCRLSSRRFSPCRFLSALLLALILTTSGCDFYSGDSGGSDGGNGETSPPSEGFIFPDLEGQALLDALQERYAPAQTLGYGPARDSLYAYEQRTDGALAGVYTGFSVQLTPGADPSTDAFEKGINAEHTLPQSKGAGEEPARSDLHNLFPAKANVNSARSNEPYAEIPDAETDAWYFQDQAQSNIPTSGIEDWSEDSGENPDPSFTGRFEPREDHKGNVARAVLYMRTVYPERVDQAFFSAQLEDLLQWNVLDPASEEETARADYIAGLQGTTNPFILDTTLARRAFALPEGPSVSFAVAALTQGEAGGAAELTAVLHAPGGSPLSTGVTAVVAFSTAASSAQRADIGDFSEAAVTFPAGSPAGAAQVVTALITDDAEEEGPETAVFTLEDVRPEGAQVGAPGRLTLTIEDDDAAAGGALVINEFLADPNGEVDTDLNGDGSADSGDEFVEILNASGAAVDLSGYQLDDEAGGGAEPYVFSEGAELAPGAYAVVLGDANGRSFGAFTGSGGPSLNNGGDDIRLVSAAGTVVAEITYGSAQATEGVSQARRPDGSGDFAPQDTFGQQPNETAGQNNDTGSGNGGGGGDDGDGGGGAAGALVITEFMADPDAVSDSQGEYFEVYNASGEAIDLGGYVISDDGTDRHVIGGSGNLSVAPGAFAVLAASSDPLGDASFAPDYVFEGVAIANGGDLVVLTPPDGAEAARLVYTDGDAAGDGVALELIDVALGTGGLSEQADYQGAEELLGNGDFGSPGAPGGTQGAQQPSTLEGASAL